ncbi:hypothetical protein ACFLV7_04610 [Chloroflexota bacterium]
MLLHELLAKVHQEELLREAAQYRLIAQAQRRSPRRKYSYSPALAWLGSLLCRWGNLLQERFSDPEIIAPSQAVKSSI